MVSATQFMTSESSVLQALVLTAEPCHTSQSGDQADSVVLLVAVPVVVAVCAVAVVVLMVVAAQIVL